MQITEIVAEHLHGNAQASIEACNAARASMEAQLEQLKHHLSNLQQQTLECTNMLDAELLQRIADGHTKICLAVEELQPLVQHQQQCMLAAEDERVQQATQQATTSRDLRKELTQLAKELREQVPSNLGTWMMELEASIAQLHGRDQVSSLAPELETAFQELRREHEQLANQQRRQAVALQGFKSEKQAFKDAVDSDLHSRLACEIAEVQRQVELVHVSHDATGERAAQLQQDVERLVEMFEAERRERISDIAILRDEANLANLAVQAEQEGRAHDLQELRSAFFQSLDENKWQFNAILKAVQNQREKEDEITKGQQAAVLDCSCVSGVPVLERPSLFQTTGWRSSAIGSPAMGGEASQSPQSSVTPKPARVLEDGIHGRRLRPHTARDWCSGSRISAEVSDWQSLFLRSHEEGGMQCATEGGGNGGGIGSPTRAITSSLSGPSLRPGGPLTRCSESLFYAYAKQQRAQHISILGG